MKIPTTENWITCPEPSVADTIRWKEPLWAAPNKARGKPDKIGEQMITGEVITIGELIELRVTNVERLSLNEGVTDAISKVKISDAIRRKPESIKRGECQKLDIQRT